MPVLVVGATGRTGLRVVRELLRREADVRAVVRHAAGLPPDVRDHPRCRVVEGNVLEAGGPLERELAGCTAVVSCLGHRGLDAFGPHRRLVTDAAALIAQAAERLRPAEPLKLVMLNTVLVDNPSGGDPARGWAEAAVLWSMQTLLPPLADSAACAAFLAARGGGGASGAREVSSLEWCVVRPSLLRDGEPTEAGYTVHAAIQSSMFAPHPSTTGNVGRFMAEAALDPEVWARWRGQFPVVLDKQ